ncbi:Proteinase inhibitor I25, cystatin, conserved region [Trema orientale]|uniref:Proteinase inhibitor I25, cystatin, conserved region n=1 Tax=Trema orientale TaxID=63057 RepID=A0A2P5FUY2_TREOI|nr:Proteinase inhibitor I25, cystatin, conserved region [Trema orientale]
MSINYVSSGPGNPSILSVTFPPPPPDSEIVRQKVREFHRQIHESEGFYVGPWPLECNYYGAGITPYDSNDEKAIAAAKFAVEASDYNKDGRGHLEYKRIVRINMLWTEGLLFYITLQASDQCFYEAKVLEGFDSTHKLEMFRPAQHYKE